MGDDTCDNSLREESSNYLPRIFHLQATEKLQGHNRHSKLGWVADTFRSSVVVAFDDQGPSKT